MNARRTFTAGEIARLFKAQANEGNGYSIDLGGGIRAVQMAMKDGLTFTIERDGNKGNGEFLRDLNAAELAEISGILWAKYAPFLPDDSADDLRPDWILELEKKKKAEDALSHADQLTPDELRPVPDDPNLEPDPSGLMPDWARKTRAEAALEKRLKDGTATVEDRLMPDWMREKSE